MKHIIYLSILPFSLCAHDSLIKYKYTLPALPYAYDVLEPYIDGVTMWIHHNKHHQAYVDNLNVALENHAELQEKSLDWLLKNLHTISDQQTRTAVQNNGGGHWNHSFFWKIMKKKGEGKPVGALHDAIAKTFGSLDAFKEKFTEQAKKVFGSGWAWLCVDTHGDLILTTTKDQDSPLSHNQEPVLGLDVWEHAYYLKYKNQRFDYIAAWWNVIDWKQADQNYTKAIGI